jgi:hypothetical protein
MSKAIDMSFEAVFRRVSELTDIKNSTMLASVLGITSASVSKQKTTDNFPAAWAVKIAGQYNLDLNYVIFGGEYVKRQRSQEDLGSLLVGHIELIYGVEMSPQDNGFKILRGEVKGLIERFLRHTKD